MDRTYRTRKESFLSAQSYPCLWQNDTSGCYEYLSHEDVFSSLSQWKSLATSLLPIRSGDGVDETATWHNHDMDNEISELHCAAV